MTVKHVSFAILCVHTSLVPRSGILLSIRDIFESNKNCNLLSSKHRKTNICKTIMVIYATSGIFFALYTLEREVKRRFCCLLFTVHKAKISLRLVHRLIIIITKNNNDKVQEEDCNKMIKYFLTAVLSDTAEDAGSTMLGSDDVGSLMYRRTLSCCHSICVVPGIVFSVFS